MVTLNQLVSLALCSITFFLFAAVSQSLIAVCDIHSHFRISLTSNAFSFQLSHFNYIYRTLDVLNREKGESEARGKEKKRPSTQFLAFIINVDHHNQHNSLDSPFSQSFFPLLLYPTLLVATFYHARERERARESNNSVTTAT